MTKKELVNLHNYVWLKYHNKMEIVFENENDRDFYALIVSRKVILPKSIKKEQTEWSLFAFLHEIGHILTNRSTMKRYEMEYLATQWALDEAKRIGFQVPREYISTYQRYINSYAKKIKRNPPKFENLMLKY